MIGWPRKYQKIKE
jgi:serine/threonine protein kinase